jgi:lysine 2,3-aminomutase
VPYVGKRWVDQLESYDRTRGISYWTKNYRTSVELDDPDALTRCYPYYDPISTLPSQGQHWWRQHDAGDPIAAQRSAAASRSAAAALTAS